MEGRKTKFGVLKEVFQYLFLAIVVGFAVYSYIYRENISEFFARNLTDNDFINEVLHNVPKLITSIQVIVVAVVVNMVLKILARFTIGLTDKGKTLANIISSLVKWVIIIATILIVLSVWGVDTTALVTGAGILALVIGLGAQSLIADILAGIFIVLEGEYVVGDIVIVDNWRGKIVSIGIRTTQLEDAGGNIKIINNSEIRSITNQTKHLSVANCSVNVASNVNLEDVENVIRAYLPGVKEKISTITEEIVYKGVSKITETSIELLYAAKCYEEDLYQVQRDLNRELKLILDKNGISSFATPSINVEGETKKVSGTRKKGKSEKESVVARSSRSFLDGQGKKDDVNAFPKDITSNDMAPADINVTDTTSTDTSSTDTSSTDTASTDTSSTEGSNF